MVGINGNQGPTQIEVKSGAGKRHRRPAYDPSFPRGRYGVLYHNSDEIFNSGTPAGWSNQPSEVEKDSGTTEFWDSFSSRAELQSVIAKELRDLDCFKLKGAMMQRVEKTLAEVEHLGFLPTDTGVKHVFFRLIEMALTNMADNRSMDILIHNSFERWIQLDILVNKLTEEICKHPSLTERVPELTTSN